MHKIIKEVLEELNKHGYQAYLVGGFVRDTLLGIKSYDVDICTSALPKEVHAIFNMHSNNYGGANMTIGNYNFDITTFRKESSYKNRKPEKIEYIDDLKTDLLRRDFTINTIVMDKYGKVIDLLNGIEDLNNRLIKMVGNPSKRIEEDPLRILRAIRFATILDFQIDGKLVEAIKEKKTLINNLSKTRVREELDKILCNENFKKGLKLLKDLGIAEVIGISWDEINYIDDLMGMWSQIKFTNLPFTNNEKSNIIKVTEVVNSGNVTSETLFKYGLYINIVAGMILNIDVKKINMLYTKLPIKDKSDIDIKGNEIIELLNILPGKIVSDIYDELTTEILKGNLKNKKKFIKKFLLARK